MDNAELSYFGITDVSEQLGISQKTVRRHIASGKLKSLKIGGVYRIPKDSLVSFINNIDEGDQELIAGYDLFGKKIFKNDVIKKIKKTTHNYKNIGWRLLMLGRRYPNRN